MPSFFETMTGGTNAGGSASAAAYYFFDAFGGVEDAGISSPSLHSFYFGEDGVLINGFAPLSLQSFYVGLSGAELIGDALVRSDYVVMSAGGVDIAGIATDQQREGYKSNGGPVYTGGSADARYALFFNQSLYWSVNQAFVFDQSFYWDNGQPPYRWFRVQGNCNYPTAAGSGLPTGDQLPGGCDIMGIQTDDAKCVGAIGQQQFVQAILARSVTQVCEELTRSKLDWQINSIKQWNRYADPVLANDFPTDCNELSEVPFSSLPACMEFTLQTKALTHVGMRIKVTENFFFYTGSGSLFAAGSGGAHIISGAPNPTTGSFDYASFGGPVITGGEAEVTSSWDPVLLTEIGCLTFLESELVFGDAGDTSSIVVPSALVFTGCGTCTTMPLQLYIQHNLNNPSTLYNFLNRNGLTLPDILTFFYNSRLETWVATQHFTGISDDNYNNEIWRFSFELACVNSFGAESTGKPVIKFSISVVRKNLVTGVDYDTRLVVLFPSEDFCNSVRNFIDDFSFNLDIKTNYVSSTGNIQPESVLLYDKANIFSSSYWSKNPKLFLRLSKNSVARKTEKKDISSILPQQNTFLGSGLNITESTTGV